MVEIIGKNTANMTKQTMAANIMVITGLKIKLSRLEWYT
jgi:hypothetical protein